MPERLMYHTGETMGEKVSKERRLTTTERQKVLTSPQKAPYESTRHSYAAPKALP
jgi:hypothetical protein